MVQQCRKESKIFKFLLKSRINSANVKLPEMVLGYLIGPLGALIINAVFTSFLNRFYTDALGLRGTFITLLPLMSTVLVIIANIVVGILIDKTKTKIGKARPYLLISAPLIALSCILIFAVPSDSKLLQLVWIAVSYNLYFAVAYPVYFLSHSLMVPLSTRNSKQRSMLSVISNTANMGAAGLFAAILFPMFIYPKLGSQSSWLVVMSVLGTVALVAVALEFCYTRERITEEGGLFEKKEEKVPLQKQLKGMAKDGYWWIIIIFYLLFQFSGGIKNVSMSYYCDYVVGTYQDGYTQSVLALVSGLPSALGVLFVWPLANKLGKKNFTVIGLILSVAGSIVALSAPDNFWVVVAGVTIKSLGSVPACYVMMALFADVLDHLEAKNGFRSDGLSMSLYSIITVAAGGIVTAVLNGLISMTGYVAPTLVDGVMQAAEQNEATKTVFISCFLGAETVAYAILAIVLCFLRVEKNLPAEQALILERQKAAVLANGGTWIDPAERQRREEEEEAARAEEARIAELRAYCERKGLSFVEEEERYRAKQEAKNVKKMKK